MATLASDNFNRADSGTLGANWIVHTGNWGIVSNKAQATTDDSHVSYDGGVTWPNDQWSQATLLATVGADEHSGTAVGVRSQGAGVNSAYEFWLGAAGVGIVVVNGGSYTYVSTSAATGFAANDVMYLEAQGTTLLAKKNGATISALTITDSTFASGKTAIAGGQSGTAFAVDDWSGGDFSATAATAVAIPSSTFHPGRSPGYAPQSARFYQPPRASNAAIASPDVTLSLTGQAASFAAGTLSPSTSVALLGKAATFATGTVTPAIAVTLSGQPATFASGTLLPAISVALLGQSATFTAGTVSAAGDVTLSLTGQAATFSAGTLAPATTVALNGQAVAFGAGNLIAIPTLGVTGTSASFAQGALAPQTTIALSGKGATFSSGTLQPPGDVTVALTGAAAVFAAGTIIASGGDQTSTGAGRATRRIRSIYRVTIDGQRFERASMAEIITLLNQAKDLARKIALEHARAATDSTPPPPLKLPDIQVSSRELRSTVTDTKREISEIYRQSKIDAEIAMLLELSSRSAHNDDAIILLL